MQTHSSVVKNVPVFNFLKKIFINPGTYKLTGFATNYAFSENSGRNLAPYEIVKSYSVPF